MKNVLLGSEDRLSVAKVPALVADNLDTYCSCFLNWVCTNQNLKVDDGVYYDEKTFIDFLNSRIAAPKSYIEHEVDPRAVPEEYRSCPVFYF